MLCINIDLLTALLRCKNAGDVELGLRSMAGTRHHFIPRFLLRGFASTVQGDEAFAWVFRSDRPAFNTNIKNIAVEGHFYTHDNQPHVDDAITFAEGAFSTVVAGLRASGSAVHTSAQELAALIAHLEARTRHLRSNFESIANAMLSQTVAFIEDHDAFRQFVLRRFEKDPESLIGPLRQEIRQRGFPEAPTDLLVSLLRPHLPGLVEPMLPGLAADFTRAMRSMLSERPDMLRAAARSGQLRGLEHAIAPEVKVVQYRALAYDVLPSTEPLPLGDSAVVFEVAAARRYTTFTSVDDTLLAVYLPLAPNLVLVGRSAGFQPRLDGLPSAVARCSLDYFVASENAPSFAQLQPLISQLSAVIDAASIERLLSEAFIP